MEDDALEAVGGPAPASMRRRLRKRRKPGDPIEADVVVFGGGIAGLTVAHELAERNFDVVVVDPSFTGIPSWTPESDEENPGLGGVARSQWGYAPVEATRRGVSQTPCPPSSTGAVMRRPDGVRRFNVEYRRVGGKIRWNQVIDDKSDGHRDALWKFVGGKEEKAAAWTAQFEKTAPAFRHGETERFLASLLEPFLKALQLNAEDPSAPRLQVHCTQCDPDARSGDRAELHQLLMNTIRRIPSLAKSASWLDDDSIVVLPHRSLEWSRPHLRIDLDLQPLPGEHGFRFFPSFYRHVFHTMRRIPATAPDTFLRRGRDTVYDNLVAVPNVGYVGDGKHGPTPILPRRLPTSMTELKMALAGLKRVSGYTDEDNRLIALATLKYMTSSRLRREREYEKMSWFDFARGDDFSPRGKFQMETAPATLLALLGAESDARTQGTILLQCLATQLTDGRQSDMLLNGPTDQAWFGPWFRYLFHEQGVQFIRGRLRGYEFRDGEIWPVVQECDFGKDISDEDLFSHFDPRGAENILEIRPSDSTKGGAVRSDSRAKKLIGEGVSYVIALPTIEAHHLAKKYLEYGRHVKIPEPKRGTPRESIADMQALLTFCDAGRDQTEPLHRDRYKETPTGPFRHLAGVQFFFNQQVDLSEAHTQYLDSPWGVTAIAQPQFWLDARTQKSGYRSVISVDVGLWARPTNLRYRYPQFGPGQRFAWGMTQQEIADEITVQVVSAHAGDFRYAWPKIPRPMSYHVDNYLLFETDAHGDKVLSMNRYPFLVNQTGRYRLRPGMLPNPNGDAVPTLKYQVAPGRFVLAGVYMQTRTRINSMEAACEAGRRAANAILEYYDVETEPCYLWDPEENEPGDLGNLQRLDEELFRRGLPHVLDQGDESQHAAWAWPEGGWKDIVQAVKKATRDRSDGR